MIVLILLALLTTVGSSKMMSVASQTHAGCLRSEDPNPTVFTDCEEGAERWLSVPLIVPWHREDAAFRRSEMEREVAFHLLKRATRLSCDREERSSALTKLERFLPRPQVLPGAAHAGDRNWVHQHPELLSENRSLEARLYSLRAALELGDFEQAMMIAKTRWTFACEPDAVEFATRAGALLCLLGAEEDGRATLLETVSEGGTHAPQFSSVALSLCGGLPSGVTPSVPLDWAASLEIGTPPPDVETLFDMTPWTSGDTQNRAALFPTWLFAQERTTDAVFEQAAFVALPRVVSPWLVSDAPGLPGFFPQDGLDELPWLPLRIDPVSHEQAANYLEDLADDDLRIPVGFDVRNRDSYIPRHAIDDSDDLATLIETDPRRIFSRAATILRLQAGFAAARTYDRETVRRLIMPISEGSGVRASEQLRAGLLLMRIGDWDDARLMLESVGEDGTLEDQATALEALALVALHRSEWAEAKVQAERANELWQTAWRDPDYPPHTRPWGAFMVSALLSSGDLPSASAFARGQSDFIDDRWLDIDAGDGDRRRVRMEAWNPGLDRVPQWAADWGLPAYFHWHYVFARDCRDPSVWVDQFQPNGYNYYGRSPEDSLIHFLRSRATGAHWAGVADDAIEFDRRAERLEALIRDQRTMILAAIAGL